MSGKYCVSALKHALLTQQIFFEEVKKRAGDFRGKFWVWNTLISTVFYLIYLLLVGKLAEHAIHTLLLLVQNTDGPFTSNNFEKRKILSADFAWVFHMKGLYSKTTEWLSVPEK